MLNKLQRAEWRTVHHLAVVKLCSLSMINSTKYSLPCFLVRDDNSGFARDEDCSLGDVNTW